MNNKFDVWKWESEEYIRYDDQTYPGEDPEESDWEESDKLFSRITKERDNG